MRWLRRFAALPARDLWMLAKAWLLLLAVRVSLKLCRYTRTRALLDRLATRTVAARRRATHRPARLARLVEVASHFVPAGRHCLTRAMVLDTLLRRRGHASRVEFGVAQAAGGLEAHAWLVCGSRVLIGGEEAARFTRLSPPAEAVADR